MTVILTVKPDLGSIFSRTILRCLGTSVGVIVGALLMHYFHSPYLIISSLALFAFFLPWSSQKSYALMSLNLTPLVLILIDLVSPAPSGVNYAWLRLSDTLIGAAIVLVFGYGIWPKTHYEKLKNQFFSILNAFNDYIEQIALPAPKNKAETLSQKRRALYGKIADAQLRLQQQLAEPGAAHQSALAWFNVMASCNRLANLITQLSLQNSASINQQITQNIVLQIQQLGTTTTSQQTIQATSKELTPLLIAIQGELNQLHLISQLVLNTKASKTKPA